jgi:hypothetical protein
MTKLLFLITFLFAANSIAAQEAVVASGGKAIGSGGSVEFSIGQFVYNTYSTSSGSVAQGLQQPYEISVVTGINDYNFIDLKFSVYPNPTSDLLNLVVAAPAQKDLHSMLYQLFDVNGRLLENQKIIDQETHIQMSNYSNGIYLLRVLDGAKTVKTFKIIKN